MNLLPVLESGLFALGQIMRFPVIALLWLAVLAALFITGRGLNQLWQRRHQQHQFDLQLWLKSGAVIDADQSRVEQLPGTLQQFIGQIQQQRRHNNINNQTFNVADLTYCLLAWEDQVRATSQTARLLVKVGPSLGLIGTLIPMGTAMAAMASGNLEAMAGQMVVAFTTTIVGIAVGAIAFAVLSAQQHWNQHTIRDLRYIAEAMADELEGA